jgi:hypothetical protein
MADITKCKGEHCLLKEKCYRYTAKDSKYRQAYFMELPIKNGICDMYWGEQNIVFQLDNIVSGNKK